MREQEPNLVGQRTPSRARLAVCRVERDRDIAQNPGRILDRFVHGEGQHVRWSILFPVFEIELMKLAIVRQQHTELGLGQAEGGEHRVSEALDQTCRHVVLQISSAGDERGHGWVSGSLFLYPTFLSVGWRLGFHGMARASRPPGFDMTYRPTETSFGPPLLTRVPSILYGTLALVAVIVVLLAESSAAGSWLFVNVVQRGVRGIMSARTFAGCLVVGAVASLLRTNMRGVRVRPDGVEYRDVVSLGIPRLRRYKWAQIDRVILDAPRSVALDLWDGSRAFLPEVSDRPSLSATLEKVAHARAIPVRGGLGLDELPDSAEFTDDDEAGGAPK